MVHKTYCTCGEPMDKRIKQECSLGFSAFFTECNGLFRGEIHHDETICTCFTRILNSLVISVGKQRVVVSWIPSVAAQNVKNVTNPSVEREW